MTEPVGRTTTVALERPVHERLGALRRLVAEKEGRELSLSDAVGWMLDRLDMLDLP